MHANSLGAMLVLASIGLFGTSASADDTGPSARMTVAPDRSPAVRAPLRPYHVNIADRAEHNTDFRHVLFTGGRTQLVVMSVPPGGEIGEERHPHVEQLIFVRSGRGVFESGNVTHGVGPGDVVVIPPGTNHNVSNIGSTPLQLYTVYAPANHIDGRVHPTRAAAQADREDEAFGQRVR